MPDTFTTIPKFSDGPGTAPISAGGAGGTSQSTADSRYLQITNNLADLANAATALVNLGLTATAAELNRLDGTLATVQGNLGLKDGTAILDLSSLTVGGALTGATADFSGALDALTLRTDTGKFLSPFSYAFRNAGDTGFRDVQMAGLTATTGIFSGDVNIGTPGSGASLHITKTSATAQKMLVLDTNSAIDGSGSIVHFVTSTDENTGAQIAGIRESSGGTSYLSFSNFLSGTGSVERMRITSDGDVGIGTASPSTTLEVRGSGVANHGLLRLTQDPVSANQGSHLTFYDEASFKGWIGYFDNANLNVINREGAGSIKFGTNNINRMLIDPSGNVDITAGTIGTDNFASQLTGWRGTYAGDWDVRSLFTDELRAKAFTADITQALAGSDFLTRSVAILDTDFTVPWGQKIVAVDTTNEVFEVSGDHTANVAVSNTLFVRESTGNDGTYTVSAVTFNGTSGNTEITVNEDVTDATSDGYIGKQGTLSVEDLPGQNDIAVFTASDWIKLPVWDRTGAQLTIGNAWGLVTGYTDQADGTQNWTFTALDSGFVAGQDIFKGSIVLDYGQSGDGYIERTVLDSQGSPYSQVVTWTGNPIDGQTVKTRTGILDGIANASGAGFYGENTFLTESLLAGDLTKASNYLEFASGVLTVNAEAFDFSATNILIDSAADRAKFGDATNFVDWNAGTLSIASTVFDLNATTLVLENTTPKLALGAAADTLGLASASDTGTYLNGSGHVRMGTTDASGNLTKGFKFDGTNALLEAGNASIGANSGSFGPTGVLTYDATEVGLAAFTVNAERLEKENLAFGTNLSEINTQTPHMLIGDWDDTDFFIVRIRAADTGGGSNLVQMKHNTGTDWGIEGLVDGSRVFALGNPGGAGQFIGGAFFDANDLWLGSATKANATVLLDGVNGTIHYDGLRKFIWSKEAKAGFDVGDSVTLGTDEWKETASSTGTSNGTAVGNKLIRFYEKRFGINTLKLRGGNIDLNLSTDGSSVQGTATVRLEVGSAFDEFTIGADSSYELEVDLSGLIDGTIYQMVLELSAFVDGQDAGATFNRAEVFLSDRIIIIEEP